MACQLVVWAKTVTQGPVTEPGEENVTAAPVCCPVGSSPPVGRFHASPLLPCKGEGETGQRRFVGGS